MAAGSKKACQGVAGVDALNGASINGDQKSAMPAGNIISRHRARAKSRGKVLGADACRIEP